MAEVWEHVNIWEFLAGLGIFLFGMRFVEESLQNLAGATFKRVLRKQTNTNLKAVLMGTTVTAVLQSSSVVTLMVLAFVGAGIITLQNALGIIIGANLGTTFTGWIVATLGFKLDIASFALPMIALGGVSLAFLKGMDKVRELARFLVGFGFLFLGLDYMKTAIDTVAQHVDLSHFVAYGAWVFFVVGFVLTALIQSSSASMVINLSALSNGIIPIESSIAMVIGSDLGTTVTAMLGSLGGTPATKRAALSHFFFNFVTAMIGLSMLRPLVYFITTIIGLVDPLYTLVAFHSLFNLMGIIVFFPFLKYFARFLEGLFTGDKLALAHYIPNVTTTVPEAAIAALQKEIIGLLNHVFVYNLKVFGIKPKLYHLPAEEKEKAKGFFKKPQTGNEYETIKQLEGEMVAYYLKIQNEKLEGNAALELEQSVFAIRNSMQAVKGIKDISHNITQIERSANDQQMALLAMLQTSLGSFYQELYRVFQSGTEAGQMEQLSQLGKQNQAVYQGFLDEIYNLTRSNQLTQLDTSTLLNVNRETYNANRALVLAISDAVLPPEETKAFARLNG